MSNHLKKLLLFFCGAGGALIASLVVLFGSLAALGQSGYFVYEMLIGLAAVRLAYWLFHFPPAMPRSDLVHWKASRILLQEGLISLLFLATCFLVGWPLERVALILFAFANGAVQVGLSRLHRRLCRSLAAARKSSDMCKADSQVIVVGTGKRAKEVADLMVDTPELDTMLVGFLDYHRTGLWRYRDIPLIGHADEIRKILTACHVDSVIVAVEPEDLPFTCELFTICEKMGVTVCLMPDIYERRLSSAQATNLNGFPAVVYRSVRRAPVGRSVKDIVDKIGAVVGIILTLPLTVATALAIKFDSRGPVLFKQTRSGLNGKPFDFYKFRTMQCDADDEKENLLDQNEMSGPVFKMRNDPRVTRIGRFLRKFSIDELPQFVNVMRGDMSLVGPRPPLPEEVARYEPWQRRKLAVKPGVTCIWQVDGRNNIDFDDWMRLDLKYIDNWSLWLDTKILAKTIPAVVKGDGAS